MTRIDISRGKLQRQKCCRPGGFTIAWQNVSRAVPTMLRSSPGFKNKLLCVSTASLPGRMA